MWTMNECDQKNQLEIKRGFVVPFRLSSIKSQIKGKKKNYDVLCIFMRESIIVGSSLIEKVWEKLIIWNFVILTCVRQK